MENRKQTFMKALSWEMISFVLTLLVSYMVTDSMSEATTLSVVLFVTKVLLLFTYERLFRRLRKRYEN